VISSDTNTDVLMLCSPAWDEAQRRRGQSIVEARQLDHPDNLIQRARMRGRAGDDLGATDDLARAACYADTSFNQAKSQKQAYAAAKELELNIDTLLASKDWLLAAGLTELTAGADAIEIEVTEATPARFVAFSDKGRATIVVGLKPNKLGEWRGAFRITGATDSDYSDIQVGRFSQEVWGLSATVEFLDDPSDGTCRVLLQQR